MRIAVGSDHAGFRLKQAVIEHLTEQGHAVEDRGCYDTDSVDYPDIAERVAAEVTEGRCAFGILICSTGIGISIAANKIEGIRAALCHDTFSAHRAREHNDANILCMGEWVVGPGLAREIVTAFLQAEFSHDAERHVRRVAKISALDRTRGSAAAQRQSQPEVAGSN